MCNMQQVLSLGWDVGHDNGLHLGCESSESDNNVVVPKKYNQYFTEHEIFYFFFVLNKDSFLLLL